MQGSLYRQLPKFMSHFCPAEELWIQLSRHTSTPHLFQLFNICFSLSFAHSLSLSLFTFALEKSCGSNYLATLPPHNCFSFSISVFLFHFHFHFHFHFSLLPRRRVVDPIISPPFHPTIVLAFSCAHQYLFSSFRGGIGKTYTGFIISKLFCF